MSKQRELSATTEKHVSQVPALALLSALGWEIVPQAEADKLRGANTKLIFTDVAIEQILRINRFIAKGKEHSFDRADAEEALRQLTLSSDRSLRLTEVNRAVHEKLVLGVSVAKTVEGDKKSYDLRYVDWDNPENNRFQATAEFSVMRNDGKNTNRCDIVLMVNGIPFGVIENKAPGVEMSKGAYQLIAYQAPEAISGLFQTVQLLIAANKNDASYTSVGGSRKSYAKWREHHDEAALSRLVNQPLPLDVENALFAQPLADARRFFKEQRAAGEIAVTEQDRLIYGLCRKARFLELARIYSLFDDGDEGKRKVARHQQYFGVKAVVERISGLSPDGSRRGGVVWHTQGSGKSLTMVMLGVALSYEKHINNPRIVIVTDRTDLDDQISSTFKNCRKGVKKADSGAHLLELIRSKTTDVITSVINKFESAMEHAAGFRDDDPNIIVLVDEGHRTQHGSLAAQMRRLMPKACYIGFTGTPILREDKATADRFGGIIHKYTIEDAVKDGAIVPLIYEGRLITMHSKKDDLDAMFELISAGLSDLQKIDLKKKFSKISVVGRTEPALYARAFDISEHFAKNWKGTGYKGQVVAPSKAAAIRMKELFEQFGQITSEVIISGPNQREGDEEVEGEGSPEDEDSVKAFWNQMMAKYGDEEKYNRQVIKSFKGSGGPDVIIVVSKLLTGFDCPRNVAMYICKQMKEENLLQAIARVNRNCELARPGRDIDPDDDTSADVKTNGYIYDYEGLLCELNTAMLNYRNLQGYDSKDIQGVVTPIIDEIRKLPALCAAVHDIFKEVKNKLDHEQLEQALRNDDKRKEFSDRLARFSKTLAKALGSTQAYDIFKTDEIEKFKGDWKRFSNLRRSAALRYQDAVDMREFEPKLLQLLNDNMVADPAKQIIKPVDMSNPVKFQEAVEEAGGSQNTANEGRGRALRGYLEGRLKNEDPALYRKFSEMLDESLAKYESGRIDAQELAKQLEQLAKDILAGKREKPLPASVANNGDAAAFYGILLPEIQEVLGLGEKSEEFTATAALEVLGIFNKYRKVQFWEDKDAQNRLASALDDYFFETLARERSVKIDVARLEQTYALLLGTARSRFGDA